jgi:hypothetical protein
MSYVFLGSPFVQRPTSASTSALKTPTSPLKFAKDPTQDVFNTPLSTRKQLVAKNRNQLVDAIASRGLASKVGVLSDGTLQLKGIVDSLDSQISALLRTGVPVLSVDASGKFSSKGTQVGTTLIDMLPISDADKTMLKRTPASYMLRLFEGIITPITESVIEVMNLGLTSAEIATKTARDKGLGKGGYVYDLSGFPFFISGATSVNIALVQYGDDMFDSTSQRQLKLLRTLLAFFVLFFKKWAELHAALVRKGLEFVFGADVQVTFKTDRFDINDPMNAKPVDVIPSNALGPFSARAARDRVLVNGTPATEYVWVVTGGTAQNPTFSYFKRSPRGLWDVRATGLRTMMKMQGHSSATIEKAVAAQLGPRPGATLSGLGHYASGLGAAEPVSAVAKAAAVEKTTVICGVTITPVLVGGVTGVLSIVSVLVLGIVGLALGYEIDAGFNPPRFSAKKPPAPKPTQPSPSTPAPVEPVFEPRAEPVFEPPLPGPPPPLPGPPPPPLPGPPPPLPGPPPPKASGIGVGGIVLGAAVLLGAGVVLSRRT